MTELTEILCFFLKFLDQHNGIFVAAFTGLLVWVSYGQYRILSASVATANKTADAAIIAANAAKRSADVAENALNNIERPYIFVSNVCDLKVEGDGKSVIKYSVSNHGKLPAIIDNVLAGIIHAPDKNPEPSAVSESYSIPTNRFIEANGLKKEYFYKESRLDVKVATRSDITDYEIFFRIIIFYHGPFTKKHESSFCWRVSFSESNKLALIPYGDDAYNYTK